MARLTKDRAFGLRVPARKKQPPPSSEVADSRLVPAELSSYSAFVAGPQLLANINYSLTGLSRFLLWVGLRIILRHTSSEWVCTKVAYRFNPTHQVLLPVQSVDYRTVV